VELDCERICTCNETTDRILTTAKGPTINMRDEGVECKGKTEAGDIPIPTGIVRSTAWISGTTLRRVPEFPLP